MPRVTTVCGFTLIEVIIYLGLFGVLMSGVLASTYPLISHSRSLTLHVLREGEVTYITEKIRNQLSMIYIDSSITVTSPTPNSTGNILVIHKGTEKILRIEEDDSLTYCTPPRICSVLLLGVRGNPLLPLNNERVSIDGFTVRHIAPSIMNDRILEISFVASGESVGPIRYYLRF